MAAIGAFEEPFELRILSGLHKGARADLPAGGVVVIGADENCDFVLRDAGIPARLLQLQQTGGAWMLQWLSSSSSSSDATSPSIAVAPNKAVLLARAPNTSLADAAVIAVQPVHMLWPLSLPTNLISRTANGAGGQTTEKADQSTLAEMPQKSPPAPPDSASSPIKASAVPAATPVAKVAAQRKPGGWAVLLLIGFLLAAMVYLVWGLVSNRSGVASQAMRSPPANPALVAAAPMAALQTPAQTQAATAAITAIATELKLAQRMRVEPAPGGGLLVRAGPLTDGETEAFAAALSRLSPRPGLRVVTEVALREAVQESVARMAVARGVSLSAAPLGLGRFEVKGRLAENADRNAVITALQTEFAPMATFDSAIVTSPELAMQMVEELQKAGIAAVQGQWQDGKLQLQAQMPKSSLQLWESSLARIATRYAVPFSASLTWAAAGSAVAQPAGPPDTRIASGLPFALQSIVGGATPYIVTADGSKVLPGGSYQNWKLVDISPQRALFENAANAKRAEVRR